MLRMDMQKGVRETWRRLVRREMQRVDGDGIFCAIRGVARSLQLRKSKGSSSIHQRALGLRLQRQ